MHFLSKIAKVCISWIGLFCLLTSCNTIHYLEVETYNPATITFPENVNTLLIVNNSTAQPPNIGYEYKFMGTVQESVLANADSAVHDAAKFLGKGIVEANYFDDILLYHEPIKKNESYLSDKPLSSNQVKYLCHETGTDAIISIDRLLFIMNRNDIAYKDGTLSGEILIEVSGVLRVYLPEDESPFTSIILKDSVMWQEFCPDRELLHYYLPKPDEALYEATQYICTDASKNFAPYWTDDIRWYYKGISSRWKEASAYASSNKWESAYSKWESLYKSAKGKKKAKLASNLAFGSEMLNNYETAHKWATHAYDLFHEILGKEANEIELLERYVKLLAKRIEDDKKLNTQIGRK